MHTFLAASDFAALAGVQNRGPSRILCGPGWQLNDTARDEAAVKHFMMGKRTNSYFDLITISVSTQLRLRHQVVGCFIGAATT